MCGHLVLGLRYRLHQAWAVPVTFDEVNLFYFGFAWQT